MNRELSILIILSALLGSGVTGYLLTRPGDQVGILNRQSAVLGRFSGNLDGAQASIMPLPDGLFQITDDLTLAPVADKETGDVLYYHANNGFVSRSNIEARRNTLTSQAALPGLRDVVWSPDRQKVVTIFSGQHGTVFQYFDYQTRAHGNLPSSVTAAAFSPDSDRLALVQQLGDESNIVLSETDGSGAVTILKTHLPHLSVEWQSGEYLSFATKDDTGTSSLYLLSLQGALTKVVDGETALRWAWSPNGSRLLYSTLESGLVIYDVPSGAHLAQKATAKASLCAWRSDNERFVCAKEDKGVLGISEFSKNGGELSLADNLIVSPEKIFLTSDEKFLVILSQSDRSLYGLKLATGD